MREERLTTAQIVRNELLDNSGILEAISDIIKRNLVKELMEKLEDGSSYVVTLGAERREPELWINSTKFFRTVHVAEFIRCMNCKQAPPVDKNLVNDGTITRLYCRRNNEFVHPLAFCAWAEERSDCVDCPGR